MKHILSVALFISCYSLSAQHKSGHEEIIYGRKDGMALTMIRQAPATVSNGKAIVHVVSGNWFSNYRMLDWAMPGDSVFANRGYTVFFVMHGSQPKYSIVDAAEDIKRAVRFIRYHASDYKIDSAHIGITGGSSGGNVSLLVSTADDEKIDSDDPVDKVSSRVQAAAVFFPPTDFFNYGKASNTAAFNTKFLIAVKVAGAFDYHVFDDSTIMYRQVTDSAEKYKFVKLSSPVYAVTPDDPPTLLIHGDADVLVPIQQSQLMIDKLNAAKVPNKLIVKQKAGHGWKDGSGEVRATADWFDKYLK